MRMGRLLMIGGAVALTSWLMRKRQGPGEKAGRKIDKAARRGKEAIDRSTTPTYP